MPVPERLAIRTEGLRQTFGEVVALDGLDHKVQAGTVFGLLGPNGAGKTTLVRILATLLRPTAGRARVLGFDVVADALPVRRRIGLAGQFAAVDEKLTGRENLEMVGRLYRLEPAEALARTHEVLERFALADAAERRVSTYSGGTRRRLDLAATLVGRPPVILLNEPTTGLDPRSRQELWRIVGELRAAGTTVVLTTQYDFALALVLVLGFAYAFSWISAVVGLSVRDPETAQSAGFIWVFPLVSASSAFVPTDSMPAAVRAFADVNPVTLVVDAVRALTIGEGHAGSAALESLAWVAGLLVVFVPLSVRAFRRG